MSALAAQRTVQEGTVAAETTRGVAVFPGQPGSLHLTQVPLPSLGPGQVRVRSRRVGVCGTDREIVAAHFGRAPAEAPDLVIGHEVLGEVEAVGEGVEGFAPGDLVTATVRRPDGCPSCRAGQPDMCLWRRYTERGIVGAHGFLAERWVDDARYLVPVPSALEPVGVLLEPLSVVEKAWRQATSIQRRITAWEPTTAVVCGAGPIGLLQTLLLRERGLAVWTLARSEPPTAAAAIAEAAGATYVSTRRTSLAALAPTLPNIDLIVEATGASQLVVEAMTALGTNGVLVLLANTGDDRDLRVPVDDLAGAFVAGNKVLVGSVNSAREDFVRGVDRLARFEATWPGLAGRMITGRLRGLEAGLGLGDDRSGVKTVVELAP